MHSPDETTATSNDCLNKLNFSPLASNPTVSVVAATSPAFSLFLSPACKTFSWNE